MRPARAGVRRWAVTAARLGRAGTRPRLRNYCRKAAPDFKKMMRNPSTSLRVRRVADAISLACQAPSRPLSTSRSSAARKGSDIASLAIASGKARTPPQARWQGLGLFASGGRTRGWPTLKSCRMNLLPEISVARLALLSRSRRQGPSRHDRQWRQLPFAELAHRRCEC